jgi:hypothetical protein
VSASATAVWRALCCVPLLVWVAGVFMAAWTRKRFLGWWHEDAPEPPPAQKQGDGHIVLRLNMNTGEYRWVKR